MVDRRFSIRIALFNFLGYCSGTMTAWILDSRLQSHVLYGRRYYPYAWFWVSLSPLVFLGTYILLRRLSLKSKLLVLIGSFAPLVIFGVPASLGFPPERPHMGIFSSTFGFALLSFLTTWLHLSIDFDYVNKMKVPYEARLERLKASISMWQGIAIYGAAGYMAFAISWAYVVSVIVSLTVKSDQDRFMLGQAGIIQILVISICVIRGPLSEAFNNTSAAVKQLSEMRREDNMS
jgi:hypothetical protein